MSSSLCAAISTFLNLWLIGLFAFTIAGIAIFLHILGAVDKSNGLPIALSMLGAVSSWLYLILQSINASHIKNRRYTYPSRRSYISLVCIYQPRLQILTWIATTVVGLVAVLHKSLCLAGDLRSDAAVWQANMGCWMFRVLVSLDAVMVILFLSIFCFLEVNGRYMPQGLFHFGYSSSRHQPQRRTLIESPYGTCSIDRDIGNHNRFTDLGSSVTVFAEDDSCVLRVDDQSKEQEKVMKEGSSTISPSPTYHTLDADSVQVAGLRSIDAVLTPTKETQVDDNASNQNLHRNSPSTISTTPLHIFPRDQLHERSFSDIPNLPVKLQAHLQELEDLRTGVTLPNSITLQSNRAVFGELTNSSTGRFQSSYALPQRYTSSNLSQLSKHHQHPSSDSTSPSENAASRGIKSSQHKSTSACLNKRTKSQAFGNTNSCPIPAWCSEVGMQHPPLTADPAIRRLTDVWETVRRESSLVHRLSQFDFGLGTAEAKRRPEHGMDLDNLTRKASSLKAKNHLMQPYSHSDDLDQDKENIPPTSVPLHIAHDQKSNMTFPTASNDDPFRTPTRSTTGRYSPGSNHNRTSSRSKRIGTGLSIMPPLPSPPRIPERAVGHILPQSASRASASAGSNPQQNELPIQVGVAGSSRTGSVRSQSGGRRKRGKRMVERGRYEMLPR